MERVFHNASCYLRDHTEALYLHVPIPGLLETVKSYYFSELLFENELLPPMFQLKLARLMFKSADRFVCVYRDRLLGFRKQLDIWTELSDIGWLARFLITYLDFSCYRPRCYWMDHCSCGWPLAFTTGKTARKSSE